VGLVDGNVPMRPRHPDREGRFTLHIEGPTTSFLRALPLVFWPLQTIDFIGYSACLICGVGLRTFWGFLAEAGEADPTLMFLVVLSLPPSL
jgi:hypothetical protein